MVSHFGLLFGDRDTRAYEWNEMSFTEFNSFSRFEERDSKNRVQLIRLKGTKVRSR